eukprot:symbB.v1.2.008132.t3/scaffold509.1/size193965/2
MWKVEGEPRPLGEMPAWTKPSDRKRGLEAKHSKGFLIKDMGKVVDMSFGIIMEGMTPRTRKVSEDFKTPGRSERCNEQATPSKWRQWAQCIDKAYEDFRAMGLEGAATQVLLEGLGATNSPKLLEVAKRDGLQLPEVGGEGYRRSNEVIVNFPKTDSGGDELVNAFLDAQETHQNFVEANREAWQQHGMSWRELKQHEEHLRQSAREAFSRCKDLLVRRAVPMRPELLRAPITPDALPETQKALGQGGDAEGALRRLLGDAAGKGLLEQSQRMAELDALPARAKELAQRGPGTLSSLLCAIAVETSLAAKGCQHVLILGGHGVSGVAAVRAVDPPGKVVIWEPLEDVANAACEVLRRNLGPDEVADGM